MWGRNKPIRQSLVWRLRHSLPAFPAAKLAYYFLEHIFACMSYSPHICPIEDIPLAARTICSVFHQSNYSVMTFLYNRHQPPPSLPYGKEEQFSIHLYRLLSTGLVLTVDDEDKKCVGVAVWSGPAGKTGYLGRLRDWLVHSTFDAWQALHYIYYRGGGINLAVGIN
jgi:hypothetical protein